VAGAVEGVDGGVVAATPDAEAPARCRRTTTSWIGVLPAEAPSGWTVVTSPEGFR
jgi:hypothetical protein